MSNKNIYQCLLCDKDLTRSLDFSKEVDYQIYHKQLDKRKLPVAFLICTECMTYGNFPSEEDIKYIQEWWNRGGFLWANRRRMSSEWLLLGLLTDRIKDGRIKIELTEQGKVLLSSLWDDKKLVVDLSEESLKQKKKE